MNTDSSSIHILADSELEAVTGGALASFFSAAGAISTYITILTYAETLGEGIGAGFYDATHQ